MTSRRKPVAFLLYVCCACATTVVDTQCVSSCSANPCSWATQWPPRTTQIQCQQIPRYDRSTGDQHASKPTLQDQTSRNEYYPQIEKREGQTKIDNKEVTLYNKGNPIIACLAGFDQEIYDLMDEIKKHISKSKRHDVKVYFYLIENCKFYRLGSIVIDLKILQDILSKYSHYYCLDKKYLESYNENDCSSLENLILVPSFFGNKKFAPGDSNVKTPFEIATPIIREERNNVKDENKNYINSDYIEVPNDEKHKTDISFEVLLPNEKDVIFKNINVKILPNPPEIKEHNSNAADFELENDNSKLLYFNDCEMTYNRQFPLNEGKLETELTQATKDRADYLSFYYKNLVGTVTDRKEFIDYNYHNIPSNLIELNDESKLQAVEQRHPAPNVWFSNIIPNEKVLSNNLLEINSFNKDYNNKQLEVPEKNKLKQILNLKTPQEDILNIQILKSNFVYPGIDRKYRIDSTTNDNQQSHLNPLQYENVGRLSELPFKNNQNHLIENNIKYEHSYSNNIGVADYLFTIPTLNKPYNNDEITTFYSNIPKKDSTVVSKANEKYKALPDTLMCSDLDKSDYLNCPKNYKTVNTSPWPSKYFSYTQSMKNAKDKVTICPFQKRFNKYFPICDTKHIPKLFYQASPCLRYNDNSKTNNLAISYQSDKENENPKCDFKCMPSNDNIEIPSNNNARFNLIENLNAGAVNEQYSTSRSEEPTLSYNKAPLLYHQEDKPSYELVYPSYVGLKPGTCDVKSQPFIQNFKANHLDLDTAMYNKKSQSNNDFIPANKFAESGNVQHTLPIGKHQNSNVDVINDIQCSHHPINNQYLSNSNADSEKILPNAIEFVPKLNCKVMSSNKPTLQTVQDCYLHILPSNVENFAKILNGYPIKSVSAKPQLCYLNAFELTNNVTMPEKTEHEFSNAAMDIKEPNLQSYEGTFPYNYKVPSNTDYFEDFRTYHLNTTDNLSNQVSSNEQAKIKSLKNNNPYILSFAPDTQSVNNIISVSPVVIDKSQLNNLQGTASNLNNFKRNNFIPNIFNNINDMETVNYYSYSRIPTKIQGNTNPNTHYYPRNKNLVGSVPNANILPDSSVLTDAEKKSSIYTLINNRDENISLYKEIDNFQKVAEKAIPTAPFIDNLQATLHNKPDNIINNLVSDKISPNLNRKDFIENKTPIDMPLTFDINDIADKRYNKYSKNNEIELSPFNAIIENFNCVKHLPAYDLTTDSQNELQGMKSTKILTPTTLKYASDTSVADNSMLTNDLNPTLCSLKIPPETDTNNVMSENFYYKLNPIETLISNAIKESHPLKDITFKSPVSRYSKPVSVVPETNKNVHKLQNREEYLDSNQQSIEKEIMINDYNILQVASNFTPSCNSFLQRPGMKNAPKNTPILLSESNGAVEVLNKNIVPISLQTEPMLSPENVLGAQTNPTLPTNLPIEAFINAKFKPLQIEPSYTNHMNPSISSYIPSLTKPDDREITEKSNFGSVAPIDKTLYNSNLLKMMSVATKHEPNPTKSAKIKGTGDIVQTALNFITFYSPNTKNTHLYRMKPEYKPRLYESAYSDINTNDLTNLAPFSSSIGPTLLNIPSEQSNLNIDKYENEQINILENDNAKLNSLPETTTLSNIGVPSPIVLNLHVPSSYSSEKSTEMNILDPNSSYSINDKRIIDTHPKKQSHTDISCINKENSNTKPIIEKVCDNNECLDINNYNNDDKFNTKPHTNNAKINKKYFNICKTINGKINEMTPKNLDHNILNQNQFDTNTRSISYVRDPVIEASLASLDHFNEVPIKMQELYPQRPKSNVLFNNQRNKCNHDIFNYINLQNLKEPALTFNPKTRIPDIYTQFNKLNPNVNEAEPLPNEDPTVSEYSAETPYSKFLALAPILKNQLQPNNPSSDCYVEQNPKVNEITLKYPTADKLYTSWDKSYVKCLKPSVYYPGGKHYSTLLEPNSKYSIDRPPHSNSVILDPKVNDLISKYTLDSYASSNKPKSYLTVNQYLKGNECPSVFFDKNYSMVNVPTSGYYTHDKLNTNMMALTSNNFDNSLRNLYNPYLKANDLVLERTKDKINVKNSYNQIPNTNSDIKYVKNDLPVESIEPYYSWLGNLNKDRKDKTMKSNENISHVQNIYQMQPNEGSTYWQGTPAIERHNRFIENASPIVEFKPNYSPTSAMNQIKQPVRLLKPHKSSENELKLYNIDPIAETKPIYSTYYSPSMMESPIVPQTQTPSVQIRPLNVENKPLYFENPAILKTKPKGQTSYLQNPITISENYNKLPHIFNLLKPSSTEVENEGTSLINTQAILENQTTLNFENQPLYLKTTNPIQENPFLYSPELEQTSETMSAYLQRPISANDSKDFGNSTWIAKNEATNSQISQPLFETQTTDSQKSKVSENYLKNLVNPPQIIDTKSKYFQNNGLFIDNPAKSNENSYKTSENKIKTCDDLKKDVYKYLQSSDNLKCELLTNKEINIPLGNIGLAKYTANDNPTTFTVKTEDPNIFIKAWNSNLKILKAKLVFETEEMGAVNFMPIMKTNAKLDPEKVQNIAKKVIREYYGEPIVIKGVYSTYKPYAVVYDVNKESVTNPNGFYILWPTYCNCGCFKCGCQCSWDTNGCKCNSV